MSSCLGHLLAARAHSSYSFGYGASYDQSTDEVAIRQITQLEVGVQARDHELTEIAKSIAQLAELFKDLSALVIDQGTLLDSVEYNIEQTAVQMEDAVRELDTATK